MTLEDAKPVPPAPPETAAIPARNKRRAMEFALVLASQGIETVIRPPREETGWHLAVAGADHERAVAAVAQYQRENRGWNWREKWSDSTGMFHPGVIFWCLALAMIHWLDAVSAGAWRNAGMMSNALAKKGEWWRLGTAVTLHGDMAHLATNCALGTLVIGFAMGRYGSGLALLLSFLAGVMGNVTGLVLYHQPYQGLGASGMVMGGLGLLAVQSLRALGRHPSGGRLLAGGVIGAGFLFLLVGVNPESDVVAHLGGFVFGAIFGIAAAVIPPARLKNQWLHRGSLMFAILLITLAWTLAWLAQGAVHR